MRCWEGFPLDWTCSGCNSCKSYGLQEIATRIILWHGQITSEMCSCLCGIPAKIEPQLLRLRDVDFDLVRVSELFACFKLFPTERSGITEEFFRLGSFIDSWIFARSAVLSSQLRRPRFSVLRYHGPLRIERVKYDEPFVVDLELLTMLELGFDH